MDLKRDELYLGRDTTSDDPVLYDADDLTTHGVIVGMTGSGKTGLGIDLIEEALLNGISCLIIDPKGDMGNLELNFPDLAPADFEPWLDGTAAAKEGKTLTELAAATASLWKEGLEEHEIGPDRMRRLRDGAEITIYTPGSGAGVGLNVLGSLQAPPLDWSIDAEIMRDEISAFVSSLLILSGIESDPVSGREHILLATIIEHSWKSGEDLDLAALVTQVTKPPFRKMGVFEVDAFFPESDRMALALQLNGLLASPTFAAWMEGEPLDIEAMLGGDTTKAAIVYLSHLSDEERQFLVTLLLGKTVTWIRSRRGTSELQKLIYMDEVFGFAPPTREPPSKTPILTILKQARAHGVGMVLATQNPVDLDYKAMSNAGTWMIGRLQTENDKKRILEGLESASGDIDIEVLDTQISNLAKRKFILHSTKASVPQLFTTRWAMSYLAGPLTLEQVGSLMKDRRMAPKGASPEDGPSDSGSETHEAQDDSLQVPPEAAEGVRVVYLDPASAWAREVGADPTSNCYAPAGVATVQLVYDDTSADLNHSETYEAIIFPLDGIVDPSDVTTVDHDDRDFTSEAPDGAIYQTSEADLKAKSFWRGIETDLRNHLVANRPLQLWKNEGLDLYSRVDESEDVFRERCAKAAEDTADAEMASLKDRFQTRIQKVKEQLASAETRFREADAVAAAKSQESILGSAGDLLGAFLGGKSGSTALGRAANRQSASARAQAKADSAEAKYQARVEELERLEQELATEVTAIVGKHQELANEIETVDIPLEKSDVRIAELKLLWMPVPSF